MYYLQRIIIIIVYSHSSVVDERTSDIAASASFTFNWTLFFLVLSSPSFLSSILSFVASRFKFANRTIHLATNAFFEKNEKSQQEKNKNANIYEKVTATLWVKKEQQ